MAITLILLAGIMATLIAWLLKQSINTQPWIAEVVDDTAHQAPLGASSRIIALVSFLAVVTSFFALMVSAYAIRMELSDWFPLNDPQLLWGNTGILVLASAALQWTRNAAVKGIASRLKPGMMVTGILTIAFLIGQWVAWQQLIGSGHYATSNPANAFFFLLTGVHGLHILGGLTVWARATARLMRGNADGARIRRSIELCTVYWHFLLLVWLALFGLLLST